jgi:hypothetical protein
MADSILIVNKIEAYFFPLPVETKIGWDNRTDTSSVCEQHKNLLLCLDGCFSGMHNKRFHPLTAETTAKTIELGDRSLGVMRHLSMSVTHKDHCTEHHAVQLMILHEGIDNLGESKRAQSSAQIKRRLALCKRPMLLKERSVQEQTRWPETWSRSASKNLENVHGRARKQSKQRSTR